MSRKLIAVFLLVAALGWVGLLSLFQLAGGGAGRSVAAPDGSRATVKYVDQSRFHRDDAGEITLRLDILKPDGEPVTNLPLQPETVKVFEQDEPAKVLSFNGPGQQGVNLLLVIDHSGSMSGERMQAAREAAVAALDELVVGRDSICVIAFDDQVDVVFPFEQGPNGETARLSDESKRRCRQRIESIDVRGGTLIAAPTLRALDLFQEFAPSGAKLLLVMTDGEDDSLPAEINRIARQSEDAGVPVFTIGFGGEVGGAKTYLRELAEECRGKYLEAPTPEDLRRLYPAQVQAATKEFSIVYQSPFPEADGQTREVRVEIGDNLLATDQYQTKGILSGGSRRVSATSGRSTSGAGFKLLIFFVLMLALCAALFLPILLRGGFSTPPAMDAAAPPGPSLRGGTIRSPPPPGARPPAVKTGPRPPAPPPVPGAGAPTPMLEIVRPLTQPVEAVREPPPMPPKSAPLVAAVSAAPRPPVAPPPPVPATAPAMPAAAAGTPATRAMVAAPPPPRLARADNTGRVPPAVTEQASAASPLSSAPVPTNVAVESSTPPSVGAAAAASGTSASASPVVPLPPPPRPATPDAGGKKRTIRPIAPPPPPASS